MPYICMTRDDVADGTVQVLDLFPNTSQRNLTLDPAGQTRYVNRVDDSTVLNTGNVASGATAGQHATGLGAYLFDRCSSDGAVGTLLTTAMIADLVEAIVALMDAAASAMTTANINTEAQALANLGAFDCAANPLFSLEELIKILSGAHYQIDKGTTVAYGTVQGAFIRNGKTLNISTAETITKSYAGDEFNLSLAEGHLAGLASGITLYGRSQLVPNQNGTSASMDQSSTGYPARQLNSMKNKSPLTQASGRIIVVYSDTGTILV